jgi:uncharacterized protein (TIGR00290 family)
MKKTLLSWSSGKDSAFTLHLLRRDPRFELAGLFTVVNETHNRVSMHATRLELLRKQAGATGLPLSIINIPDPCSNEQCDVLMKRFNDEAVQKGIECMAFGDLFLQDVRRYRENQLQKTGIQPLFPLWGIPSADLAGQMLNAGIEAYISCVDPKKLSAGFAGQRWTKSLIEKFPPGIDPCGENGEFHTVVVAGLMFREPIPVRIGEIVSRGGFVFADVIPID